MTRDALATRLALTLAVATAIALAVKCALDLIARRAAFPAWFAPLFAIGIGVLALLATATAIELASTAPREPLGGARARLVWLGLAIGVPCTCSVHAGYPFRVDFADAWTNVTDSLRVNYALAILLLAGVLVAAWLDRRGRRGGALGVLAFVACASFVPNDDCANPFNAWWIAVLGASPLMFVPNVLAIASGAAALRGFAPGRNLLSLWAIAAASLALGLGHRYEWLW
ncbi:MAG: hypothetical protein L6Q99_06970 [Planctomycetes bacterium]|nr:hypothetical protein [Planctomycetota bacterium]